MKKFTTIATVTMASLMMMAAPVATFAGETETVAETETVTADRFISFADATEIATKDAGLNHADITFSKKLQTFEDGIRVYEIEFMVPGETKYEYTIDATTADIIFSLAWVKDGLLSKMLRGNDLVKNAENYYKKRMRPYGYKTLGYVTRNIGGENADGLRYTYTAQGIDMTGETCALRRDNKLYYIHCYYRTELSEESRENIEQILDTATW